MGWKKRQNALFTDVCSAVEQSAQLTDAHVGIALAMCDLLEGKHRWRSSDAEWWALSLPEPQDRSLVAALVAFYYAPLLPGVHVLFEGEEDVAREAALYREVGETLGFGQVGLRRRRQGAAAERIAATAPVTLGSVEAFHLDRAGWATGLGIFRVESAPAGLQSRYRLVSLIREPNQLSLFPEHRRRTTGSAQYPGYVRRRVEAIRARPKDPQSVQGFTLQFDDRRRGKEVAGDPGFVEALLAKHDRLDLIGKRYVSGPTPDGGYAITFPEG